jgi:hypothetical protein
MTADSDDFRIRTLVTTINSDGEQVAYDLEPLDNVGAFDGEIVKGASSVTLSAPIILQSGLPGTRETGLPAAGVLVAAGTETASVLWDASQVIAPVSTDAGLLSALALLRQVLLRLPTFMGLLLLGREVHLPDHHTPASLAKLRLGVHRSAHNDPSALDREAREMIKRSRAERREAVGHYRSFARDLRQRAQDRKLRSS